MSRFPRIRRRPDHWSSPHERARAHAAERLDGPLGLVEASWLDEHLAGCDACAAIAASYEADRLALRSLRDEAPVPPRDLWARTAAAIEREAGPTAGPSTAGTGRRGARRLPVGVLSGLAVIVVVVGVSAVSGGLFNGTGGTAAIAPPSIAAVPTSVPSAAGTADVAIAAPTPIAVGAGDVQWFDQDADGQLAFRAASVDNVCPVDASADCATLDGSTEHPLGITAAPKTIIGSPNEDQAIVVTDDGGGRQQVTVMALPTPEPSPTAVASAAASTRPSATPTASPTAATPSVEPTESTEASDTPSSEPTASTEPTATATPTDTPTPTDEPSPSLSPSPTVAATLAIASDVTLVGEAAAFSADGSWFAFSARPADGTSGPDVYVWHVGDEHAARVTDDGQSYFGSWLGSEVLVSRPGTPGDDGSVRAVTVAIDPTTGTERPMGDLWRPVVDPTGTRAVAWNGTLAAAADGTVVPSAGHLELRDWSSETGALSAGPGRIAAIGDVAMPDFDVHWDESGSWFATWIADPVGTGVGRLSLHRLDPATGRLEQPDGAPTDVQALPGFSLGEGRLAWATPPGQSGEGSRVQVVAWTGTDVGTVETSPGGDLIVVR